MKGIVLAGGSGTRLWPLSRQKYSKQFLKLIEGTSLLDSTYKRLLKFFSPQDIITITNKDYYFYVKDSCERFSPQMSENIISEPISKNTAPAIALGTKFILDKLKSNPNEIVFVFSSDHIIKPTDKFVKYLSIAKEAAEKDYLVTFGIRPTSPETGYGYIKAGEKIGDFNLVEQFTEKPDLQTAKEYIKTGKYFWNAGIFAFKIARFLRELQTYQPEIYGNIDNGYDSAIRNFHKMPSISIDYAVMEKSKKVAVVPMDIFWSDVGSWDSFYKISEKDSEGNVLIGDVKTLNTKKSLILSNKRLVTAINVEDIMIIETDDAVLVSKMGNGQEVKKILTELKKEHRKEATEHPEVLRPWGKYKVLEEAERYKIKKIVVKPGEALSLQMHYHRSEHWIVIKGTAHITIGEKTYFIHEGESTFVPKSTPHRLANPGKVPLEIIEVQNGEYVGEDDIVRFDDKYGRIEKSEDKEYLDPRQNP